MAKEFAEYALVSINSVLIGTAQSISWGNEHNDHEIYTVVDGLAGMSKGTSKFTASISMVLLQTGTEIDLEKLAQDRENVEISIICGDKSVCTKGWIKNPKFDFSIDKVIDVKFDFIGSPETMS